MLSYQPTHTQSLLARSLSRTGTASSVRIFCAALLGLGLSLPLNMPFNLPLGAGPVRASETQDITYQAAPAPLDQLLDAPFLPGISLSPDQMRYVLAQQQTLPDLAELAEPELRLAGLRLNPDNTAPSRTWNYVSLSLHQLRPGQADTGQTVAGLPAKPRLANLQWSPDGRWLAFSHSAARSVELWLLDSLSGVARQLPGISLNRAYGSPFSWLPDSQGLIVKQVTRTLPLPPAQRLPSGPVVTESQSQASPGRTYQDLLRNVDDVARFKHYVHSQLFRVGLDGQSSKMGSPGLIISFDPSPNGDYLLVRQLLEPFSYAFPASRFPQRVEVWTSKGLMVKNVAELPLADKIPIHFDAVRQGRRGIDWRADAPATLYWREALDGGDPGRKQALRDRLMLWQAPFNGSPRTLLDVSQRIEEVVWGRADLALVYTGWYQSRQRELWHLQPDTNQPARKLLSFSSEDRYQHPGLALTMRTPQGSSVLQTQGQDLFLAGDGAGPDGERPFLDRWNPFTGVKQRLWQSQAPYYERLVQLLDPNSGLLLTRRESVEAPPNYMLRQLGQEQPTPLTNFPHPTPFLASLRKQIIEYTRADGVKLNGTLYLPPGYQPGSGPLPLVMWAYPREFKNSNAAGQVKGSPYSFVRMSPWTPLVFLTQGYAVLDDPAMPIVGEGLTEPNDSYLKQLVASAEAAVDKVVEMGVADRKRIAIGGHSYGAFMTVNLLAHSDLFAAGIARSGAYNRTLTPFGFQSEQRTLWQAPEVYLQMSPLLHAEKIKEPLLLIHGEADDNSGTYPMQSQNLFAALKGLGAPVRLVMLPYESHSYRSRESLGHMFWEMTQWLNQHLKQTQD
ncbi:MAG: S9 family peptidase [Candidatus Melainabacteria bacterium HGW-Melainabacteria-1]|nr:MAG: S9 family peptidase [Candidatus Melainabacteria bacterium HGW-Melainabacteria-1]